MSLSAAQSLLVQGSTTWYAKQEAALEAFKFLNKQRLHLLRDRSCRETARQWKQLVQQATKQCPLPLRWHRWFLLHNKSSNEQAEPLLRVLTRRGFLPHKNSKLMEFLHLEREFSAFVESAETGCTEMCYNSGASLCTWCISQVKAGISVPFLLNYLEHRSYSLGSCSDVRQCLHEERMIVRNGLHKYSFLKCVSHNDRCGVSQFLSAGQDVNETQLLDGNIYHAALISVRTNNLSMLSDLRK